MKVPKMTNQIQIETIETLLQFLKQQKIILENSPDFATEDNALAHHYLFKIEAKALRDLRKLPWKN